MKNHFVTGLAVLLPIIITLAILHFLTHVLTKPFLGLAKELLHPLHTEFLINIFSLLLSLIFLVLTVLLVGFLGQLAFFNAIDRLMHKIPFANKIYKSVQDFLNTAFSNECSLFSNPVEIPFPSLKSKGIGFKIQEEVIIDKKPFSVVYVPGTPTPLYGLMIFIEKEEVLNLPFSSEEAAKFIASCGLVASPEKFNE